MRAPLLEGSNRRHRLRMMPAPFILAAGLALTALAAGASESATTQPDWQARDWAMACMTCHNAAAPVSPGKAALRRLEGRPATELVAALQGLRNGTAGTPGTAGKAVGNDERRPATLMPQLLKGYRDDELQRIAAYFASLPASQPSLQSSSPATSQPPVQASREPSPPSSATPKPVTPAAARAPQ